MAFDTAIAGSGIVAASISDRVVRVLLEGSGRTIADVQRALDSGEAQLPGFELSNVTATVRASVIREKRTGNNVVAYLPATGSSSAQKPWIGLGAHYDHLGHGAVGNSLAGKEEAGRVHYGADDNASGVAAVLAAGAALARQSRARNVLLAFWSGEEIGLLGSSAFVRSAPIAIDQLAAYLNFDMVGRMQDNKLIVQAAGTSTAWRAILERTNVRSAFDLVAQDDPYQPTDVATFNEAGVPSLSFFTGPHTDYHRPTDTADKLDYRSLDRIAAFAADIVAHVDQLDAPPVFVKVQPPAASRPSRAGARVFTGTIPDYASDAKGLLLSSVIGGGPADKAGLQKGDVIVEMAGQTIANIYDYTYALDALKPGVPVKIVFMRGGERRKTMLTPLARN
jgi:Zn-dependent M28 family amino/carboxypeptidase